MLLLLFTNCFYLGNGRIDSCYNIETDTQNTHASGAIYENGVDNTDFHVIQLNAEGVTGTKMLNTRSTLI